jgi:transposase InsO family protein
MSEHDQPSAPTICSAGGSTRTRRINAGSATPLSSSSARASLGRRPGSLFALRGGWALSAVNDRFMTLRALEQALRRRCPNAGLLHHSDQGSTYASEDYRRILAAYGIICSMSRRGNCLDNAAIESWFSTLKSELGERFRRSRQGQAPLFDYIEIFYNQRRRHSSLDYVSPGEYERAAGLNETSAA